MMFGDRLLHITLARVWAALSAWEKVKLIWTLVHTGLSMPDKEELKEELETMKVCNIHSPVCRKEKKRTEQKSVHL